MNNMNNLNKYLPVALLILLVSGIIFYGLNTGIYRKRVAGSQVTGGFALPVKLSDLGRQLVDNGTIDKEKFLALYTADPVAQEFARQLLEEKIKGVEITAENQAVLLNYFWALGLASKNEILEKGPMMDERYGGAGGFASTGGWTIAVGQPMDHYSHHAMIKLTPEQQAAVEQASKNIFRPCCSNPAYFPDCNHGMAMLGLLELMAAQGGDVAELKAVGERVNSYWFPGYSPGCAV